MRLALELAARGQGHVEPNPMVGCVIARDDQVVSTGWHKHYGGPHAEIEAIQAATERVAGSTMYVTLEPCCHHGKTPPCTDQIIATGIRHVVIAEQDPYPAVRGGGLQQLAAAGVQVETGVLDKEAHRLNKPYHQLVESGRPWIIAKWAMTLDGRIASYTGSSQWVSGEASRRIVHDLRGRVDGILVGRETVMRDDPLLTARPSGARVATRIVADSTALIPSNSQLVRTATQVPVVVAVGTLAEEENCHRLTAAGCEVFRCEGDTRAQRLDALLAELGRRRMTNVLAEGGGQLLGTLFDLQAIHEVHVFIAPKLIGGTQARAAILGTGLADMSVAAMVESPVVQSCDQDVYVHGRMRR